MAPQNPAEPTSEQCSANERVPHPGGGQTPAYAVWWPQMGGYSGRAIITAGDCPEVWVWHDGAFPFSDDGKPGRTGTPARLHLCDSDQWIELFEKQKIWAAEWRGDDVDPDPYIWQLPQGVTREQAQEVYEKITAWGLWEPDPGGFKIRTHEGVYSRCEPVACPPFTEVNLQMAVYADRPGWEPGDPPPAQEVVTLDMRGPQVRAGVDPARPVRDSGWNLEDPLLVQLADARLDAADRASLARGESVMLDPAQRQREMLSELQASAFRHVDFRPAPGPAQMPRVVTLPEGVTPEVAEQWIQGCIGLGIVDPGEGGTLYIPHGMAW